MKSYSIKLDGQFVLGHNDDLPIAKIVAMLEARYGDKIKIRNEDFSGFVAELPDEIDIEAIKIEIEKLLETDYADANDSGLEVGDYIDDEEQETSESGDDDGDADADEETAAQAENAQERADEKAAGGTYAELLGDHRGRAEEPKPAAATVGSVMKKINALVAASEFKALAAEIVSIAPSVLESGMTEVLAQRSYLFSINDGYGLSTCLRLFAELLSAAGLIKFVSDPVTEIKLGPIKAEEEAFAEARKILGANRGAARLLCIDISEWMNDTESAHFKKFLRELDDCQDKFVIVFRLPFVDRYILERVRYSLNDLCFVSSVSFPPFNVKELRKCASTHLKKYGLTMTPAAWKAFDKRITEERCDGKFYGLRTVKKVMMELLYNKQLADAASGKNSSKIDGKTAAALCIRRDGAELSGSEMLERLVGSKAIVDRVNEIVAQIELAKASGGDRPCIHMRFVGNPGTGKTTVARILGKILKEKGILRVGDFHECRGRDLCGMYVGTTAPKTASICRDAYGSVLFIDEAYSLYRSGASGNDYGREALDTLIAEMENHRSDFVVIMAGYTDEMKTLMDGNSGLASRMPYTIEFPNFTREQLFDIYKSMIDGAHYRADQKCLDAVRGYIDKLPDAYISAKEFSNARFVRNLFERTAAKAALRLQLEGRSAGDKKFVIIKDDFDRAIGDGEFKIEETSQRKIGFKPV